ncbi:sensor histidine kinase [Amycolatopsis sp. H20-H5]|uniref:sensor histidine kinase n=1 Tax=Amycolatopsis sp. H20-H5 TaxID=3046309 RepID=UPI002DBE1525|nr:histidine kinase [Amycolatopsis sp. H20-H5]MEC3977193.1 histidine kinase [Amycolatopsis sp. H20-H5]
MPPDSSGPRENPIGWLVCGTLFMLPMLVPAVQSVVANGDGLGIKLVFLTATALYYLCYALFPLFLPPASRRVTLVFSLLMLADGVLLSFLLDMNPYVLIYATAVLAFALAPAWALIFDGLALLIVLAGVIETGRFEERKGDLIAILSLTATMFLLASLVRAVRRLTAANKEIATLAVAGERERMARDLHDILGHSLTTITVKAGLARRVLEASGDTGKAITEIREVEGLSRSALSDIRATVSEYREVSLSAELAGARAALRAMEIDADLPHAIDNVRPDLQRTFGYVLRETVTNVLRHSGATRVKVRFGRTWLEIEDDGSAAEVLPGNGLRGLSERLELVGGTVVASVRPKGGLLVRAEVPQVEGQPAQLPVSGAEPAGGLA